MRDKHLIEEMNRYYDRHAPWHDSCMGYTTNAAMEALLKPIIESFERYIQDKTVLEIACGTGNWTQVLSKRARTVAAIDISSAALGIARTKEYVNNNVTFKTADAYTLEGVGGSFEVGFAADWWSHVPKSALPSFLERLHGKLVGGARVVVLDMSLRKEFEDEFSCDDNDGNRISRRSLPDGSSFSVVKNFPTKSELAGVLDSVSLDFEYHEYGPLKRWMVTYRPR
jgi:2-polyprenyl-3-methyl-5-hydroxy-6-metoxy-1,4-benzoquinol methylase